MNNVDFSVSNNRLDDLKNSLLKDAIGNAKTKADVASAVGLKVIGVRSMTVGEAEFISASTCVSCASVQRSYGVSNSNSFRPARVSATVNIIYLIG